MRVRLLAILLAGTCIALVCACAAPPSAPAAASDNTHASPAAAPASQQPSSKLDRLKPRTGGNLPPRVLESNPSAATGGIVEINRSCRVDADCAIKDVGSCCGAKPACVNAGSPTDPAAVQAACARTGRLSTCGFKAISSCQCAQGQCRGVPMTTNQAR